jgi:hypothetical protein
MAVLSLFVFALLGAGANREAEASEAGPAFVQIRAFTYGGSGCAEGSLSASLDAPTGTLWLESSRFEAEAAGGVLPAHRRKFCQVMLDIEHSPGWSFAIASATYRGTADLDPGVTARSTTMYWFTGGLGPSLSLRLSGPLSGDFIRVDRLAPGAMVFSPCGAGRPLNLKADVAVSTLRNPSGSGSVSLSPQTYQLVWRRCSD